LFSILILPVVQTRQIASKLNFLCCISVVLDVVSDRNAGLLYLDTIITQYAVVCKLNF